MGSVIITSRDNSRVFARKQEHTDAGYIEETIPVCPFGIVLGRMKVVATLGSLPSWVSLSRISHFGRRSPFSPVGLPEQYFNQRVWPMIPRENAPIVFDSCWYRVILKET
jgi:hypothetical protein